MHQPRSAWLIRTMHKIENHGNQFRFIISNSHFLQNCLNDNRIFGQPCRFIGGCWCVHLVDEWICSKFELQQQCNGKSELIDDLCFNGEILCANDNECWSVVTSIGRFHSSLSAVSAAYWSSNHRHVVLCMYKSTSRLGFWISILFFKKERRGFASSRSMRWLVLINASS